MEMLRLKRRDGIAVDEALINEVNLQCFMPGAAGRQSTLRPGAFDSKRLSPIFDFQAAQLLPTSARSAGRLAG
jgi:hypothetical protein